MVSPSSPCSLPIDKKLIIVLTKDVTQIKTSHLRARRRQQRSLLYSALLSLCDRMWSREESRGRPVARLMISPPLDGGEQQELQIYSSIIIANYVVSSASSFPSCFGCYKLMNMLSTFTDDSEKRELLLIFLIKLNIFFYVRWHLEFVCWQWIS